VRVNCLRCVVENLLLKPVAEIKDDIVRVGFNGESEEINLKLNASRGQILECKSELSAHNEYLNCLCGNKELVMGLQELTNVVVRKDYFSFAVEELFALVVDQNGDEID